MILEHCDLERLRKRVAMVDGGFDPLHIGHLEYFESAAALGKPLLCNVQSDRYMREGKGRPNLLPEDQRAYLIDSLRSIAYVHLCKTSTADVLEQLRPLAYVKGADWKERGLPRAEVEICERYGIEIVYLDTMLDSSTRVSDRFAKIANREYSSVNVAEFESFVRGQEGYGAAAYDQHYFEGEWREGDNVYSLEKRREIEAQNPANIKAVFQPRRALDVGCGPGFLMYFLHELGVETWGIDFSEHAKRAAPPEVRDRIHVGDVTEYYDLGHDFDLVICRELLEHLTVLQVRQAVRALAQHTKKFLYITTRYHPEPKSLLDVTSEKHIDPTHITLLNKDFLHVLFLLEGLKSRPDLEECMDWKKVGRVLVFERI